MVSNYKGCGKNDRQKANFWGSNTGSTQRGDGLFFVIWNERSQRKISSKAGYHISNLFYDQAYYFCCGNDVGGEWALDGQTGWRLYSELRDMPVYGQSKRKSNVHNMTVRQLMNHTSGLHMDSLATHLLIRCIEERSHC